MLCFLDGWLVVIPPFSSVVAVRGQSPCSFPGPGDSGEAHEVEFNPILGGCLPWDVVAFYDC